MKHKKGVEKTKSTKSHERPQLHRSLNVKLSPGKSKGLLNQLQDKLKGSKFRWINEKLYTQSGNDSLEMIQKDVSLFDLYHEGFREQVTRWPLVPVDVLIKMLKKLQRQKVGDFGCGDGKIYKECKNQDVYSFDLVSKEDFITACDIAHVPLEDGSLDIGIFCLALMGTNWSEFIAESNRCLHEGGQLWIAEVRSRFESESIGGEQGFIRNIEKLGFKLYRKVGLW
ncbi:ribosomal RNA-processing [Blastocystis sp. subtype 4]|uniref:ribosomal RNA-processing n=1 Tax=Blastocystis sp. subtype 4 TaxID=944170 RepID=UPI000711D744|nr:ribosomal RNA-processing [Blastocystis sp. subtype 4]KNB43419.1 ribosomal RNA-processing [Blastocystis sp. subtype 4]|eukprot:XP_014526850.1 ribosomal RNA-processing [Blastocystis sp. subtype 4]